MHLVSITAVLACIRGVIASASLKLGDLPDGDEAPETRIRGVIASASLKPQCESYSQGQRFEVSEALLPRPH